MLLIDFAPYVPLAISLCRSDAPRCSFLSKCQVKALLHERKRQSSATGALKNKREMQNMSREQQRLLDGLGDFVPDDFLGAGVTVALEACDLGGDAAEDASMG